MRNTVAKRIRKLVARDFAGQPLVAHTEVQKGVRPVPTGELAADGTQKVRMVPSITIVLDENCQRAISQFIKRNYNGVL